MTLGDDPEAVASRSGAREDALAWLRLARTETVGPATFLQLVRRFGGAAAALDALPDLARASPRRGKAPVIPSLAEIETEIEAGLSIGARLLRLDDPAYPPLLREIDPPPPVIWVMGAPARLTRRAVAVVGARNASALGRRFAADLAEQLSAAGLLVASGLARGIDAAAHRGALDALDQAPGAGGTASVLAGGVDHVYPPEHADLHAEIAAKGALVSEMPIGLRPVQAHFRRRNRLISGLALGVVVVEGAERSGSLITARAAADQGREAMAAPGHPSDARAAGCNALIRDGAALIRGAEDVLEALAGPLRREASAPRASVALFEDDAAYAEPISTPAAEALRARLLDLLSPSPTRIDDLARAAGAPEPAVLWALAELEIAGLARREPGGLVACAPDA